MQFIILAVYARPVPVDPYNPLPPYQQEDSIRHPSPFVPIRLHVFAIVMWSNDLIVKVISVGGGSRSRKETRRNESTDTIEEGGDAGGMSLRPMRNRASTVKRTD